MQKKHIDIYVHDNSIKINDLGFTWTKINKNHIKNLYKGQVVRLTIGLSPFNSKYTIPIFKNFFKNDVINYNPQYKNDVFAYIQGYIEDIKNNGQYIILKNFIIIKPDDFNNQNINTKQIDLINKILSLDSLKLTYNNNIIKNISINEKGKQLKAIYSSFKTNLCDNCYAFIWIHQGPLINYKSTLFNN